MSMTLASLGLSPGDASKGSGQHQHDTYHNIVTPLGETEAQGSKVGLARERTVEEASVKGAEEEGGSKEVGEGHVSGRGAEA